MISLIIIVIIVIIYYVKNDSTHATEIQNNDLEVN